MVKQSGNYGFNSLLDNNPLWLVDVGASGGIDPRWKKFTHHFKAILFEPDIREYHLLKARCANNFIVLNSALSDSSREMDFHLCKRQQASSTCLPDFDFLKKFPDVERFNVLETIKVKADSLDNQLRKNNIAEVDFIKIDAQGHNLPILQGSTDALDRAIGLDVEIEFSPIYHNQPLFSEVDNFIRQKGFDLFDIRRYFWKRKDVENYGNRKGQLVFGDVLYFKSPEKILLMKGITEEKIIRAISVYLAYGYLDVAQTLLDIAGGQGVLSEEKHNIIKMLLSRFKNRIDIPYFKGRGRIMELFLKIAQALSDGGPYSGTDNTLGNP